MRVRAVLIGLLVAATFAAEATASSRSKDVAATNDFIATANSFLGVAVQQHSSEEASANALIKHIASKCPRSLPSAARTGSAAQRRTWTAFTDAAGLELSIAEFNVLRPAARTELTRLGPLRWSVPALNRAVSGYIRATRAFLALRPPDLCTETRAASRSRFTVVPSPIAQFLRLARASKESSQPSLSDLATGMQRFVTRNEAPKLADLRRLDTRFHQLQSAFVPSAYNKMIKALSGV